MTSFREPDPSSPSSSDRRFARSPRGRGAARRSAPKPIDEQALYEYALGVLGRGMRTEAELRRLLKRRLAPAILRGPAATASVELDSDRDLACTVEPGTDAPDGSQRAAVAEAMIEAVMARLRSHQYLSDARYAAAYASLRREGRRLGARRVAQDLRNKGVPAEIIRREVETAYEGTTEEAQARAFLARKRVAPPAPGSDRDKARILRMLARAGFSSTVAWNILRSWNAAPDEPIDD